MCSEDADYTKKKQKKKKIVKDLNLNKEKSIQIVNATGKLEEFI